MSHLSFETIARLVDEQPSALDNAHLDACATCRAELDAMRADVAALASLPDLDPADEAWHAIEARLEAEGLLRKNTRVLPFRSRTYMPLARAAAVAAIFAGGALVGHTVGATTRTQQVASNTGTNTTTASHATSTDHAAGSAIANAGNANPNPVGTSNAGTTRSTTTTSAPGSVRLASTGNDGKARNTANGTAPVDGDAALRNLRSAEDKYFSALSSYSEKSGTETTDPNARLAVLEGIVLTTGAALAQAPTDPVINGYHLTALAQRDALLKQIKATPARVW